MGLATPDTFVQALAASMRRRFGEKARVIGLERLSGGASQELWSFDVEAPGEPRRELILRRNPGGTLKREGAAGMETEARLIELAREAGAPAPAVAHVFTPDERLGSGYVMARVPGETLGRRLVRDEVYEQARRRLPFQLGAAAAKIHTIDPVRAGSLRQTSIEASLEASYALHKANGANRPVVEWAFRWLWAHRPGAQASPCVVHGDMRNGNIMVGEDGLRAVLDWEAVHIGDPMEDLAWICVPSWRFGATDKPAGGFGPREELYGPDTKIRVRTTGGPRGCAVVGGDGDRPLGPLLRDDGPGVPRTANATSRRRRSGRRASETEIDLLAMLAARGDRPLV